MKGIVGNTSLGAFSVVVNDGYEDDIDEGDVMWVVHFDPICSLPHHA